jgi:hypothetical protein
MPIFAHLGHWYVSLPVFGGPVVIVAVIVKVSERRRARDGDSGRLRVAVTRDENGTILTVSGALDYPTLLDIEHELGVASRRASSVQLDLSNVTAVEQEELAWSLTEAINSVEGADVTVLIGSAPALRPLREISALEGVKLVNDTAMARSAPPSENQGP